MKGKKRIYLGFVISLVLLYFSFKGISFHDVWLNIRKINPYFIIVSSAFIIAGLILRALRWKFLLRPIRDEKVNGLFSVLMIGYFSNNILPARIGELVRAQFLGTNYNFSRMQALATILVERVFDGLMLLGLFGFSLFFYSFPLWMRQGGVVTGLILLVTLVFLYIYGHKRRSILGFLKSHANSIPLSHRLMGIIENFGIGLSILNDVRNIVIALALTILIWLLDILSVYFVLLAFGFNLSLFAPVFVTIMIGLGTMIPSSPSYIGVYEAFGILALAPFGVEKEIALGFSLILHFVVLAVTTSIGFVCFIREFGSLREGVVKLWPVQAK